MELEVGKVKNGTAFASWRNVREMCCGMGVAWDGVCVLS